MMTTLCPSGRCVPGAGLLGIVGADGLVRYLGAPVTLNRTFVRRAWQGANPEHRFRFVEPCVADRCAHWAAGRCELAAHLVGAPPMPLLNPESALGVQQCGIMADCQWRYQHGPPCCERCAELLREPESPTTPQLKRGQVLDAAEHDPPPKRDRGCGAGEPSFALARPKSTTDRSER